LVVLGKENEELLVAEMLRQRLSWWKVGSAVLGRKAGGAVGSDEGDAASSSSDPAAGPAKQAAGWFSGFTKLFTGKSNEDNEALQAAFPDQLAPLTRELACEIVRRVRTDQCEEDALEVLWNVRVPFWCASLSK
jgi:hypothetical protein